MDRTIINNYFFNFLETYDQTTKDEIWKSHQNIFNNFWNTKIININSIELVSYEIDEIIRILDKHGKGNKNDSESIAKTMIRQSSWITIFNEIKKDERLAMLIDDIIKEYNPVKKSILIDSLFEINKPRKNYLTGASANWFASLLFVLKN